MGNPTKQEITKAVFNKNIVITGGSSGIGKETAKLLAECGAHVILVARSLDKLEAVKDDIESQGGRSSVHSCDLTDINAIEVLGKTLLKEHHHIDILINNAGRSIRRSVSESVERFHDFERTMSINYFGAVKLVLMLLPSMKKRKSGHIVNISSIGVLANTPRFSAYIASKAALDAFSRCLAAEVKSSKIHLTSVFMPLVRTPMIAPTKLYNYMPALSPEDAAFMIAKALVDQPQSIASFMGRWASASYALTPSINVAVQSIGYRIFPSSKAARTKDSKLNIMQKTFAKILPGEHH